MRSGHKTAGSHTSSRHDASRYHRETDSKRQSPGFLFLRKPIPTDYEIRICRTNTNEDGFPHVFSPIPQNKRTLKNKEIQRGASGIRTVLTKVLTVFPKVLTVFSKVPTVFPKVLIVFSLVQTADLFPPQQKSVGPTAIFSEQEPAPNTTRFFSAAAAAPSHISSAQNANLSNNLLIFVKRPERQGNACLKALLSPGFRPRVSSPPRNTENTTAQRFTTTGRRPFTTRPIIYHTICKNNPIPYALQWPCSPFS